MRNQARLGVAAPDELGLREDQEDDEGAVGERLVTVGLGDDADDGEDNQDEREGIEIVAVVLEGPIGAQEGGELYEGQQDDGENVYFGRLEQMDHGDDGHEEAVGRLSVERLVGAGQVGGSRSGTLTWLR